MKKFTAEKLTAIIGGTVCGIIFIIICILINTEANDILRRETLYKKENNFKIHIPQGYREVKNSLSSHNFKCYKKYHHKGDTIMCSYK